MNWKVKALIQKFLSTTKLGDKLNHIPVTLQKNYHYNVTLYQTHECVRKFSYCKNINLTSNKTALEIGTGYSLISSIVLSLIGFKKIITVDITKDIRFSYFKKQITYLKHPKILKLIGKKSIFSEHELEAKIDTLKEVNSLESLLGILNVTYIAPYKFEDILEHSHTFDYICSQVVLEHVPPKSLDEFFKFIKKVLTKGCFSVHTINFIDHYANPGFFQDKSISEFNFLRYSDSFWNFWSGNPIAYTNRLSYLFYLELCEKHNLDVVDFIGENYRKTKGLPSRLIHKDILKKYDSKIDIEDLTKYQRGTLIISKT